MAYRSYQQRREFFRKGVVTKGKILELVGHTPLLQPNSSFVEYSPIIEFEHNGQKYNFQSNTRASECTYVVGEEIEIRYLPENTQIAEIEGIELETDVPEKEKVRHVAIGIVCIIVAIIC